MAVPEHFANHNLQIRNFVISKMMQAVSREPLSSAIESPLMKALVVVGASLFVALCARFSMPLPFTPVPLTMQNFAVILVGLLLGWRLGLAALLLYLAEGAMGLPVFASAGPGGIAQLLGPTGGYLIAYPVVAAVAGWIFAQRRGFASAALGAIAAEVVLFTCGVAWLTVLFQGAFAQATAFGLYPFVAAEGFKVLLAAGIASRWHRDRRVTVGF